MWSKQADVTNKNVTSFKNKISQRKRKNVKSRTDATAADNEPKVANPTEPAAEPDKRHQRHKKNRKNSGGSNNQQQKTPQIADKRATSKTGESVVLRASTDSAVNRRNVVAESESVIKRFSDSFVIENGLKKAASKPDLIRENSGVNLLGDKTKKSRRFSDIFRSSNSLANNETNLISHLPGLLIRQRSEIITTKDRSAMAKTNQPIKEEPDSYLKRVKSKIYKSTKTDNKQDSKKGKTKSSKENEIPEEVVKVPKSSTHLDFRLIRQTSNLERIKSNECIPVQDNATPTGQSSPRPIFEKAKSSSAINLNLLRARRNKILEQVKKRNCKDVNDEFDFIAFGGEDTPVMTRKFGSSQFLAQHRRQPSWLQSTIGESKPSQPVSRSGSDRRPDSVREEFNKHNDNASCSSPGQDAGNEHDETSKSHTESPSVASSGGHKKRGGNNINRSESVKEQSEKQRDTRKQRRNISDPSHNTTSNSVVDLEHTALSNTTDSGSSSNSSISTNDRLSESPSNSTEAVRESGAESDMDAESQPLDWHELVTEEQLNNLQPHEKKRQDVINELFHTEISHVTSLKVLYKFFHKSLQESSALKPDELSLIFPNIKEVLDVHVQFRSIMIRKRKSDPIVKELGDMLLNMFGGSMGEAFRKAAATFCERQQLALEFIKERRKRDSKFDGVLCDCEKRRQCRRLQLQAILPVEMQRLSKYPLLLERLIGAVQSSPESEELEKLKKAHQLSKDIVNYVNEATKEALNRARLGDIQKHLDQSNFERNEAALDLTRHRLVIEGPMQLRRPNKGPVPVHVLLLEEIVLILQKEGDRYVLKYFTSGIPAQPLSPIIKISSLLVRANAVHKDALFLVNTSTTNTQKMAQMYDLITEDDSKRALWFKHFSDATKAYQEREGKTRRPEPPHDSDEGPESVQELSQPPDVAERAEEVDHEDDGHDPNYQLHENTSDTTTKESIEETTTTPEGVKTRITAEEWPLIQPSHVHVEIPPVHSAESRLTHIEQIRRKDEEVIKALTDKEDLVADLLCIPRQNFQTIADMSSDLELVVADPLERIMAAIYQTDRLQRALNEALTVSTESEAVQATGGRHPSCSSQTHVRCDHQPAVPTTIIQDVTTKLSHQLTRLLEQLKQHDEEKIMLRNELHKVREKLHEKHCLHNVTLIEDDPVEAAGDAPETNEEVTSEPGEPSVS